MDIYEQVRRLGTIVGIWAHPDDESWSSAGLMKIAAMNGQHIELIVATDGSKGNTCDEAKWPADKLGDIRRTELKNAMKMIDNSMTIHWLGYEDGSMSTEDKAIAVDRIGSIINQVGPDTIITFEPNGVTGHDDHRTIHAWAVEAARKHGVASILQAIESTQKYDTAGKKMDEQHDIFFNTDSPNLIDEAEATLCLKLDRDLVRAKMDCLQSHASQSECILNTTPKEELICMLATECFV